MRRLRTPDWLTGAAGVTLLAGLAGHGGEGGAGTVWLALVGVLALLVPVVTATRDAPALPVALDVLTVWAGIVSLPVIVVRVLSADERDWGLWLTAAAVLAVLAGAWWAMRKQAQPGLRPPPELRAMPTPAAHDPSAPPT